MSETSRSVGYALLCVLVPVGWGLIVVYATAFVERRLKREPHADRVAPAAQDDQV